MNNMRKIGWIFLKGNSKSLMFTNGDKKIIIPNDDSYTDFHMSIVLIKAKELNKEIDWKKSLYMGHSKKETYFTNNIWEKDVTMSVSYILIVAIAYCWAIGLF